jgi:hypothetical protein
MNKTVLALLVVLAFYGLSEKSVWNGFAVEKPQAVTDVFSRAYQNQDSKLQVVGKGEVVHLLPDDTHGSQHQKFILKLPSGQTLLIAHNIDLAPRIVGLNKGDNVEFSGEYEWNQQGGVVHWTHLDPQRIHVDGWLKHQGVTYE